MNTDGVEEAIRNALERAGSTDAQARARVYQSARAAMERSLARRGQDDQRIVTMQRERVEDIIARIEADYADASGDSLAAPVQPNAGPSLDDTRDAAMPDIGAHVESGGNPDVVPLVTGDEPRPPFGETREEPVLAAHEEDRLAGMPPGREQAEKDFEAAGPGRRRLGLPAGRKRQAPGSHERHRRSWRRGLFWLAAQLGVIAALVAGLLWWISANGGIEKAGERLARSGADLVESSLQSGQTQQTGQRVGAGQFSGDWMTVLDADGFGTVETGGAAAVERMEKDEQPVLRIASLDAGEAGEVRVPLSADVLDAMRGRDSVIALTVSAGGDQATQITVRCTFPQLPDCVRRRYDVLFEQSDLLFDISVPQGASLEDGALMINSDITGEGRPVDIHGIRLQPAS